MSLVLYERRGPVALVTINRPEVRNCVDGPTAVELAAAFRRFESEDDAAVAILSGADGCFCAGADLKGVGDGRGNRVESDVSQDGPMGPSRMLLDKPVLAAVEGYSPQDRSAVADFISRLEETPQLVPAPEAGE